MPPKGRRAPIALEEDSSDGDTNCAQRSNKPVIKKSNKKKADTEDTEEEEEIVKKISKKPIKRDDETEAVAIIYQIESEKHPFYYLNGVPDSVEISKLDCTKNEA